ncbi:histidine kinase [Amycolatopsis sp. FDAARGOS 1241]|uniref:sensor histidine kinase n=1 Tax=Amycolatopsis sp. FDAARGOS 1241 TaxID=2778070 RepID=UPI00194E515E|nr:histidine kinase [Amycolatopsis sp. FDAARGOS 1241]QRP45999.1 sensor histidine kinase [Amycolatopsis sp. FDAARGOS 1241]
MPRRRAFALAGLALLSWLDALVELLAFLLLCVGLVFFLGPVLDRARGRAARTRELAGRWCGVEVTSPYRPEPPDPERERDGWYRDGNQLYKRAWWIRWNRRFTWMMEDPATGRELGWQLVNPPFALVTAVLSLATGTRALRWYGRWTSFWLGPRPPAGAARKRWLHRHAESFGHQIGLLALSLVHLGFSVWQFVVITGAAPVAAPLVVSCRTIPDTLRREAGNWTGVRIARPYLPPPGLPVPRPDGLYQVGKQLYDEPWWPVQRARTRWILHDRATWRDLAGGALIPVFSLLLTAPTVALLGWGLTGLVMLWAWRPFASSPVQWFPLPEVATHLGALAQTPVALALIVGGLAPTTWLARQQARFARLWLGPTEAMRLAQRAARLDQSRTDVTVAQAAELRRIERDLHDGIQSRLVAMGLKLGAIEALIGSDPEAAKCLAAELRNASSDALTELRLLVRGIHPPVLSERGLVDAVRAVALDSPLKVDVTADVPGRVEQPVEACVYFAVCELLGNAAKHGGARRVSLSLAHADGELRVVVTDDGTGGAEAARGSGLRGIERRLGGFDGRLTLTSPPGGPTEAIVEVPCQLSPAAASPPSSPRTSTSSGTA